MTTRDKKIKKRLILLDAHAILHRAYHALPDFSSQKGEPTGALYGLSAMLIKIITDLKPDYIVACYDLPGPTFRHEAYEDYKAKRPKTDNDLIQQLNRSRDIFEAFHIPFYEKEGFEADDILGTIVEQTKKELKNGSLEIIIASGDMDTLQLVDGKRVQVYTLKKGINDTIFYDEKAVNDRFGFSPKLLPDFKGLRGDPSDNIIGIAGIGEKTATLLIQAFGTIEEIYAALKKDEEQFREKGFKDRIINLLKDGEEEALFSKTLGQIRLDVPISFSLPKEIWKDSFTFEKISKLFNELNFRTLLERAKKLSSDETLKEEDENEDIIKEAVSDALIKKVGIALWLVNSTLTNPTIEDILQFTRTTSFSRARELIFKELKEKGLEKLYKEIELPLIPILDAAQKRGILIDAVYLKKLSNTFHKELNIIKKNIYKEAGVEFNINSPKQLGEILFDKLALKTKGLRKTDSGAQSTRESELLKLKDEHPIIEFILQYREIQKLLSTYIDNIPAMLDKDNFLHTTFVQTGTTTGRFSSINPNLQNIPVRGDRGKKIRSAFVARRGHTFVAFDYSQIELRALAIISKDKDLARIFKQGKDIHASVAAEIFSVPEEKVTADMRRKAKVINFGIIYGMGVTSLHRSLGGTRAEAQKFYDSYFEKFPGLALYIEKIKKETAARGYTETLMGRRRYFEGINSHIPYIRSAAERMAINAPLQGTNADIVKIAMSKIHTRLEKERFLSKTHLLLQVHDELIYEVEDGIEQKIIPLIKEEMEGAIKSSIPIIVDVSSGKTWGTMKPID